MCDCVCMCVCLNVCVWVGAGGVQLDDVEVTQCEVKMHTLKLANTYNHTHTD